MKHRLVAGAGEVCITPTSPTSLQGHIARVGPPNATLDDLWARGAMLTCDGGRLLFISLDLIGLEQTFVHSLKRQIIEEHAITPERIFISCSHIHTGPPTLHLGDDRPDDAYLQGLRERLLALIGQISVQRIPVNLRFGSRYTNRFAINRRRRHGEGIAIAPNPAGPVDPEIAIIGAFDAELQPLFALMNLAMHPTVLARNRAVVSADYPGRLCQALKQRFGERFVPLFLQGAAGDSKPLFDADLERFSDGAEADIEAIGLQLATNVEAIMADSHPVRHGRLPALQRAAILHYDSRLLDDPGYPERVAKQTIARADLSGIVSPRLRMAVERWQQEWRARRLEGGLPRSIVAPVQALALSPEVGLVWLPGEPFAESAIRIKKASPFRETVVVGYANGTVGYLPTARALERGGYECEQAHLFYNRPAPFDHHAAATLERVALEALEMTQATPAGWEQ